MFQATVSGKTAAGQFILDIGNRQVTAEARASLSIGSRLDLQVVATTPQIELQIIHDPLSRRIGQSLHLFDRQARTLAPLPDLARQFSENPALSKETRAAFTRISKLLHRLNPDRSHTFSLTETTDLEEKLSKLLYRSFSEQGNPPLPSSQPVRQILQNFFSQLAAQKTPGHDPAMTPKYLAEILKTLLDQELPGHGLGKNQLTELLTSQMHQLFRERSPAQVQAPALREFLNRLGLNFEQLLARGQGKEAAGTLKGALYELQRLQERETITSQASQLLKTLDLFGLLQAKLSSEGLFFIPLPLPFLEQGYILLEKEQPGSRGKKEENSKNARFFSLYLKLQGLGNLSIEIRQQEDELILCFRTEGPEQAAFFSGFRTELHRCIAPARLHSVQFLTGVEEPLKNIVGRLAPRGLRILDTRV